MAGKDLRVEWRSRATLGLVVPFAGLVLILFGFALDADHPTLRLAAPGLFWLTALFVTVVAAQRSAAAEAADSARRMLLLAGVSPGAVFAGKAAAVAVQLLAVEAVMVAGVLVFYGVRVESVPLLAATGLAATAGLGLRRHPHGRPGGRVPGPGDRPARVADAGGRPRADRRRSGLRRRPGIARRRRLAVAESVGGVLGG